MDERSTEDLCSPEQNVSQPFRLIDHHVVTGIGLDDGLPAAVRPAFGKSPVESSLRILRYPHEYFPRKEFELACDSDFLKLRSIGLRTHLRVDPGVAAFVY
jgi:hypothetical protein